MPGLKVFGLFIFLIVFSETRAQITEPAWVQSAIPEDPDGKALSEQSSENITHINSDKLNGHLESKSLEVVPSWFEKSAEKYSTEVGYDNAAVSENSQPFDSALVENYKDDILSFDLLSSTDRASYDEGTATKGLTDGFEHHDVINDSVTSGDSVAGHGGYANGDESYKFVNDYESSSDETTDGSIFSSSYPDDENDKELFESYDPIDGELFKQDDATTTSYHHDDALLKRIEELFARGSSEFPSQTASTATDNDWERIFGGTTQKVDVNEDGSSFDSEAINKSDETTISPLDDTIIESDDDIDTTATATASSNTGDQENDGENISASIDSSISTKLNSDRNDENDDDVTKDIETTTRTILLRPTEPDSKTENYISTQIKDDEIEASNESVIRENITTVDSKESQTLENFDKSTSLSEEFASQISEQINEPTSQRTEDYGIETTTNNEYSIPLVATVKNLNENNFLKKYNIEDDNENVPVEESKEGEFEEESTTSTTEKYKVYKTIDYDYSNEKNDTDSVESSTEAVTDNLFKPVTSDFMSNIGQETDNGLVTDGNVFENYETENQRNEDAVSFNEPTTQSVVYVSHTDVVQGQGQDNSEETIEPTDTTSEYGSETNVNNKNVVTTFDGNNKNTLSAAESNVGNEPITTEENNEEISTAFYESNPSDDFHPNEEEEIVEPTETHIEEYGIETNSNISSTVESKNISEEFPENEPIVSTTEVDNEDVSTAFYEVNPSHDNLHPNKKEETTEPIEAHIEEYDTETNVNNIKNISSSVGTKDRSEEFSENEPIVSTIETGNEEVSTTFYEANPSDDNLHPNKKEGIMEPTETLTEEYVTETNVNNSKDISSTVESKYINEEFPENEPIVSTTEADNEEISTVFYKSYPNNANLYPNKKEETTESTETHIEEYDTESTVETKDRSEEFSENEPIVSTTEADNEEVSTKFYEVNSSNDNLHLNKAEGTTEPTETHIEEYDTESTVETKDRNEEFSENEPIVSTTEADNEEVSTKFYEVNSSNDNLHLNKAEGTIEPTETHSEEYGTESTVETKDRSGEFSENESIVSTTEVGSDDDSTAFYEVNSSDNLHFPEKEEKELVENTTIMREESIGNFTDSTIETIITTAAIPREAHNDDQFFETNRATKPSTESNDNILTTIIYNSYNEKKGDVSIEAMKFSQEELEESTTETTTISYETSSKGYNYKEKDEREPVESTMSVLIKKEITLNFKDSTTEEIVSTTETDSAAKDNSSYGAEAEEHLQEEEKISVEESTTSISIEKKTVKYFTDGETEKVLTTTEMSEEDENFSEDNLEEIDEPTSQRIGTFTEDDGRDTTVNNVYSAADFKGDSKDISTTIKYEFLKENSEEKDLLFDSSTKKYSIDKESFNEEGETDFLESTSVSIKEEITSSFIDNSESNTTEKIVVIPEIESEMHSMQTESNEYFSKDVVDVTESSDYVTVENSYITTETFTETRQVAEEIPIETVSSSSDIYKNDSYPTESSIDDINTTDDNETVSTTPEDYSDGDDIVIENESRGSTQNEENVFVTTEKENTEKINIETTTVLYLQGEKNFDLEITKIFDNVNDNVTKLINDYIKKLSRKIEATSTANDSFTTSDSSEDYSANISSEESTEEEEPEEEKVKISSNEVSAVNVSNRWSTFDITSLGGGNHDYDQSVEDSYVEEYEDSNENKTVTPYMEESEPYIKANVFGNQANVSIKIEIEDDAFHVPSNAHFDDDSDKHILNITWPSSHMQLNNSILLTLKENPELYIIHGAQLNLVEGDDFDIWNENFTVVQENSTFGKTNFVVKLEDDARIYFSNLDFLRIAESDSNDGPTIPSAMKIDTKEIGIATGCIAAALFVCATIYFIISRSRKRVVHIEQLSKNDIPV